MPRAQHQTMADAEQKVLDIISAVRSRGFAALGELAKKFDGVEQSHPRVPAEALTRALTELDPAVRAALEESISRARQFADQQRPPTLMFELGDGAVVSQNWIPVGRVGLYVPGGLRRLASSVIMNVVPALAAGVESIALASPPQKDFDGLPHPTILAAAKLLGIDEVYAIGGAQAIAVVRLRHPGTAETSCPLSLWTWSRDPATFSWPQPSGWSRAWWASTRRQEPRRLPFSPTPLHSRPWWLPTSSARQSTIPRQLLSW